MLIFKYIIIILLTQFARSCGKIKKIERSLLSPSSYRKTGATGNRKTPIHRIIGGNNAYLGSWPWQALIKYQDYTNGKSFFCGGTLISSSYVLTAAHCTVTMNISGGTTVFLGTVDSSKHEIKSSVAEKVVHPDYSANRYLNPSELNDIAILRLAISVKYTDFIQPICLPVKNYTIPTAYAYVIGFGSTNNKRRIIFKHSRYLKQTLVPLMDQKSCSEKWEELEDYGGGFTIDDSQICAGALGHGSAQGDSGGPLLVQEENGLWYQIGITSFGVNYGKGYYDQGLAPGIYTRVTSFCDFITKATHSEVGCSSSLASITMTFILLSYLTQDLARI